MGKKFDRLLRLKSASFKKATKLLWTFLFCFFVGFPLYIASVRYDLFGLFGGMPSLKDIENPDNDLSSELISADGVSLGRYFRFNRSQVSYDQLSPDLVNTLLISEDHRFRDHSGLDFQAFLRVFKGVVTLDLSQGGGSTITQQLAKNLFTLSPDLQGSLAKSVPAARRLIQKTKEWMISVHLERNFTKDEIIAMYLNTCSFSNNAYGIKVATETYFKKQPDKLNLQESAVLVGMLQNPSLFNPKQRPKNALSKRNEVLEKLFEHRYIKSKSAYDSLVKLPIALKFSVQNQNQGIATYLRSALQNELTRWCRERGLDLLEAGLKIHTTIDSRMQRYAVEAVEESMRTQQRTFNAAWRNGNPWIDSNGDELDGYLESRIKQTEAYRIFEKRYGKGDDSIRIMLTLKKPMTVFTWRGDRDTLFSSMDSLKYYKRFLHAGFMSMDPQSGAVRAWVGGINHKYFKYDHVRQGSRQPGSTFKPFVYGTAMEAGYTPCQKFQDISPTFNLPNGATWTPANSGGDRGTGEMLNLRRALALSKNSITAQLLQKLGAENIVNFAHRVGIKSKLDPVPALCLGVSNVSLYELVGSYSTFVNLGIHTEPFYITRIEDKNGNVLENFIPVRKQVINDQTAFNVIYMLMGGVEEVGGTSGSLDEDLKLDNEIGAKTGTTNDASDGWYMGITHNLVSGAWVGGDEPSIHYREWAMGSGGRTAKPIWEKFMLKVYADRSLPYKKGEFRRPQDLDNTIDCSAFDETQDAPESRRRNFDPDN
jgi:penicillin-binding protein 1A